MDTKISQLKTPKTKARLFLSDVPNDFNRDRDLALGPWCFSRRDEDFPGWETIPFVDAFETSADLDIAATDCEALASHLVLRMSHRLNARHGLNCELPYWWTLVSRWILYTVTITWRRWVHLEKFINEHGEEPLVCPVYNHAQSASWDFKDSADFFQRGVLSESFDFWLWSICLNDQTPNTWDLTPVDCDPPREEPGPHPPIRSNTIRHRIRSLVQRTPYTDVGDSPAWVIGFFSLYLMLLPKRRKRDGFCGATSTNPPDRFPKSYLGVVDKVIEATMPRILGPDFQTYKAAADSLRYVPGRIFINGSAITNDRANFQIAHAIEAGELVVRSQHGSDYGTMKHANVEAFSEYVDAAFFTWGWTSQNSRPGKFLPLPSMFLSRIQNRHRQANSDTIFVGTKMALRCGRIDHSLQPTQTVRYRQEKLAFINALDARARRTLHYRPYDRSKMDMDDATYITRYAPDVLIFTGELEPALLKCRLLVLDHPGTTLNIAMAANIPTLCFWDPNTWPYAPEAEKFFTGLSRAGIIHPDGPSAASYLNTIIDDVEGWWAGEAVQAARHAWANQFARTSKHWWLDWARALASL